MKLFGKGKAVSFVAGAVIMGALAIGGPALAAGSASAPDARRQGPPPLLIGAVHADGTWTFLGGAQRMFAADFGRITAAGSGSITLHRADGQDVIAPAPDGTCIRQNGQSASLSDLTVGEPALMVQESGSTVVIRAGRPFGEGCGLLLGAVHGDVTMTYVGGRTRQLADDRGRVTSVGGGSLSLLRRDGQTVTVTYDGTTRVIDDCRPGTIADVKVGGAAAVISENGHADAIRIVDLMESKPA